MVRRHYPPSFIQIGWKLKSPNHIGPKMGFFPKNGRHPLKYASHGNFTRILFCSPDDSAPFPTKNFSLRCIITKIDQKKNQFRSVVVSIGNYKILDRRKKGSAPKWKSRFTPLISILRKKHRNNFLSATSQGFQIFHQIWNCLHIKP